MSRLCLNPRGKKHAIRRVGAFLLCPMQCSRIHATVQAMGVVLHAPLVSPTVPLASPEMRVG